MIISLLVTTILTKMGICNDLGKGRMRKRESEREGKSQRCSVRDKRGSRERDKEMGSSQR